MTKKKMQFFEQQGCQCCQGCQAASSNLSDFNLYKILLLQMGELREVSASWWIHIWAVHKVPRQMGHVLGAWPVATLWVQPLSLVSCCSWHFRHRNISNVNVFMAALCLTTAKWARPERPCTGLEMSERLTEWEREREQVCALKAILKLSPLGVRQQVERSFVVRS